MKYNINDNDIDGEVNFTTNVYGQIILTDGVLRVKHNIPSGLACPSYEQRIISTVKNEYLKQLYLNQMHNGSGKSDEICLCSFEELEITLDLNEFTQELINAKGGGFISEEKGVFLNVNTINEALIQLLFENIDIFIEY